MKRNLHLPLLGAALVAGAFTSQAALLVPGADGSDGSLNPSGNVTIDLGQALTTAWTNAPAFPGGGVYDPDKWAVVFKYSSVLIASNRTVTFKNHPSTAPVVWLVNGDVTINGIVDLTGGTAPYYGGSDDFPKGGPGGFRGGGWWESTLKPSSGGFGPGGGDRGYYGSGGGGNSDAGAGSYSTRGQNASGAQSGPVYGNARILPLIGGSGGGGRMTTGLSGGAGGGALLVAATGRIVVNGTLLAEGGNGYSSGSGGAVRLVADELSGQGRLSARGPVNAYYGGTGRIRLEANRYTGNLTIFPSTQVFPPGASAMVWPPATAPTLRIVSVGSASAPSDPNASLGPIPADVTITNTTTGEVVIESRNLNPNATVTLRVTPKYGSKYAANATADAGSTFALSTWRATINLQDGFSALQVHAVAP